MTKCIRTEPLLDFSRFDGALGASYNRARNLGGLPQHRIGGGWISEVGVGRQPKSRASARGVTGEDNLIGINIPFGSLGLHELEGSSRIHDGSRQGILGREPIGDMDDRDAVIQKILIPTREGFDRAMHPSAAMDVENQGCRLVTGGLPEVQPLAWIRAIGHMLLGRGDGNGRRLGGGSVCRSRVCRGSRRGGGSTGVSAGVLSVSHRGSKSIEESGRNQGKQA